ncbi:ATP/GTP-binding protein [Mycobacterium kyorinense]|uniref:ATP/GTP-binding protein n=1 Tax=Mycobacterium kyorinense TaxID=487514 RepID=A0A1X1Y431_9MYCO|nr:ATP/GTP-binding protein [Mycobacterium kyorinense]ORW05883.1 ATP/GTP-binding protein [Mycobacterium kyorinense]
MTEAAAVSQLEERRQPTTTLEGWRRFVDADPPQFTLLDDRDWSSLSDAERTAYDEARVAHHSEQRRSTSASAFARFLGLPTLNPRMNVTDISDAVCQVLIDARTDIVVVDEIHNLNLDTRAGEELSDHLKYFTEHLPATFVYAGIDVERSGVFTGTRGRQLAGRCAVIHTSPFPFGDEWTSLVAAMEGTLRLHRHQPGTLVADTKYLHRRTNGMIGSLAHLIRSAAIQAMLSETEQVTRELMDTVLIDYAAHTAAQRSAS